MELERAVLVAGETFESILSRWLTTTFSRHLIALCWAIVELDDQGRDTKETFSCCTGFLIELEDRWYMVTAGHCWKEFRKVLEHPRIRLTGIALVGGFGSSSDAVVAEKFQDYEDTPKHAVHDRDLDYCWIEIRQDHRDILEQKGAVPVPLLDVNHPKGRGEGRVLHVIVGFPDELVEKNLNFGDWSQPIRGEIQLVMISANALDPVPPALTRFSNQWFIGQLNQSAPLRSAKGLSGGPIIEISEDADGLNFRIIALQSWWEVGPRIVFGCPADVFLPKVLDEIQHQQQLPRPIEGARTSPGPAQDAKIEMTLEQTTDDRSWEESFSRSQDQLARLAQKAREDIAAGRVHPLKPRTP